MRMVRKMMLGTAIAVGTVGMVNGMAKLAECAKKWFAQGYEAGHFVGFMDGGMTMAQKYDEVVKTASELGKKHSVLAEKYNDLCEEYDELEREYRELCDEYYGA